MIVYAALGGSCEVRFLTEKESLKAYRSPGRSIKRRRRVVSLQDPSLQGKYWVAGDWEILSTAQVLACFASGQRVDARSGPHETQDDAASCVDAAWEAPGG